MSKCAFCNKFYNETTSGHFCQSPKLFEPRGYLKGTMNIELIGHDFKENPKRTNIKLGKLKLPAGADGDLLYVGENDTYLHCFVIDSGAYYGIYKSTDDNHIYQHILKLNQTPPPDGIRH